MTEQELRDKFLGKLVRVKIDKAGFQGTAYGECTFIGYNELLKSEWITVTRTPIKLENYDQVKLV